MELSLPYLQSLSENQSGQQAELASGCSSFTTVAGERGLPFTTEERHARAMCKCSAAC